MEQEINDPIIDACVQSARNKGYNDAAGVLRGTIMLAHEPISMDELCQKTGYSKSTVSSNMNLLENLGLVRRIVTPGDKRYRYLPVTDSDSLRLSLLNSAKMEVELILNALEQAQRRLQETTEKEELRVHLSGIQRSYKRTERLLELVVKFTTEELIQLFEKALK